MAGSSYYDTKIELNEYIEKMSEIEPQLQMICEDIRVEVVGIYNDGCKPSLLKKIIKYLEVHGVRVVIID